MRIAQRLGSGRSMRLLGSLLTLLALLPVSTLVAGRTAGAQVPGLSAVAQGLEIAAEQNIGYMPGEVLVKLRAGNAFTSPLFSGMLECFGLEASGEVLPGVYKLTSSE